MSAKRKLLLSAAVLVLVLAGGVVLYGTLKEQAAPPPVVETEQGEVAPGDAEQEKAPDITVYDMDGNAVKLSDLRGKPIVLNFWASWCPPCKSEMPQFDAVYAELGEEIQFMMVDLVDGGRETVETGKAYLQEQGFSFPVFFDTDNQAGMYYGIRSIPTTIFIDKDGYSIAYAQGAIDEATLRQGIDMMR